MPRLTLQRAFAFKTRLGSNLMPCCDGLWYVCVCMLILLQFHAELHPQRRIACGPSIVCAHAHRACTIALCEAALRVLRMFFWSLRQDWSSEPCRSRCRPWCCPFPSSYSTTNCRSACRSPASCCQVDDPSPLAQRASFVSGGNALNTTGLVRGTPQP